MPHRGVVRLVDGRDAACDVAAATCFLQFAPVGFDASMLRDLWLPLLNGARRWCFAAPASGSSGERWSSCCASSG